MKILTEHTTYVVNKDFLFVKLLRSQISYQVQLT